VIPNPFLRGSSTSNVSLMSEIIRLHVGYGKYFASFLNAIDSIIFRQVYGLAFPESITFQKNNGY
jgi:hypothetical protein